MVRDITIGQYYNVKSPLHELDPRVKLLGTFLYVISLFVADNYIAFGLMFLCLSLLIIISKVPLKFMLRGLKPLFVFILLTVFLNLFTVPGANVVFSWKVFVITKGSIKAAFTVGYRLTMMIVGSSLVTYTTCPSDLAAGLEKSFSGLKKIGVPVTELSMIMTIALRFIPILTSELDRIMKAQMSRGMDYSSGTFPEKLKKVSNLAVPLFVSSIKKSSALALAMDARCYNSGKERTRMNELKYDAGDGLAYLLVIIYVASVIWLTIKF